MKKLAVLALTVLMTASLAISSHAVKTETNLGEVPKYLGEIEIDGERDDIYDQALTIEYNMGKEGGEAVGSGTLSLLWGNDKFYALFEVIDDDIVAYNKDLDVYKNEAIEFTLDFLNDGSNLTKVMIALEPKVMAVRGTATEDIVTFASALTEDGWNIEFYYDLTKQDVVKVADGVEFGIGASIDNITGKDTRNHIYSKPNVGSNDNKMFDYISLGSEEIFDIVEEVVTEEAAAAPSTSASTADVLVAPLALVAVSSAFAALVSKKRK